MRVLLLSCMLLSTIVVLGGAEAQCFAQPVHVYGSFPPPGHHPDALLSVSPLGSVSVADTNVADCDSNVATTPDYDGDLDAGTGGAAFGWGANAAACGPHNVHGPNVAVSDNVWGSLIQFVIVEDDQNAAGCLTDGIVTGGPGECVSPVYTGVGTTCGSGGGDGLFWVVFVGSSPPPFTGTVVAF